MPLIIVLVECGIELIPRQIRNHSSVRRTLSEKNYYSQLLDNAFHYPAMKSLKNPEKRGRPDIAHICLLNALGSPLNKSGNLKVFVHTVHDKIFEFNPKIRIARNCRRFKGLMAKMLIDNEIQANGSNLITRFNGSLEDLINSFKNPKIMLFSKRGKLIPEYRLIFSKKVTQNSITVIGGFQKSTFSEKILSLSNKLLSLSRFSLDAWIAVNKVINYYELIHDSL